MTHRRLNRLHVSVLTTITSLGLIFGINACSIDPEEENTGDISEALSCAPGYEAIEICEGGPDGDVFCYYDCVLSGCPDGTFGEYVCYDVPTHDGCGIEEYCELICHDHCGGCPDGTIELTICTSEPTPDPDEMGDGQGPDDYEQGGCWTECVPDEQCDDGQLPILACPEIGDPVPQDPDDGSDSGDGSIPGGPDVVYPDECELICPPPGEPVDPPTEPGDPMPDPGEPEPGQ